MLSRYSRWVPSSARSPNLLGRPLHSARCVLEDQKDVAGPLAKSNGTESDRKRHSIDHQPNTPPILASQKSSSFRPSAPPHPSPVMTMRPPSQIVSPQFNRGGYPQIVPNQTNRLNVHPPGYPPNFQHPNPGQPSSPSQNVPNQSFQRPPPAYAGAQWVPRTPSNFHHQRQPGYAPPFAQRYPPPPFQSGEGFPGSNGQPPRHFPQGYASPSNTPQSFSAPSFRPPYPPGSLPQPYPAPGMSPPSISSTPDGVFPHHPMSRHQKRSQPGATLDFDFQDLAGPDALGRYAQNQNATPGPMPNNSLPFPHQSTGHRIPNSADGRSFGRPAYYEPWRNGGPGPHPTSPQSPSFNPRNSDWNKSRPGVRTRSGSNPSSRTGPRPNHGLRGRGRGMVALEPEPSLPPPPKTILDERGNYGVGPAPLGAPESILSAQSSKGSKTEDPLDDYKKIREMIAGSNTPVDLPGFSQAINFESSHLLESPQPTEISWTHGQASKDQIVKRAFDLVIKNPSLEITQKRQTVALVDFLLLSREERLAKIKPS